MTQNQVCGVSLTDNVVEVIFHVFDLNQDGNLSAEEFIRFFADEKKTLQCQRAMVSWDCFLVITIVETSTLSIACFLESYLRCMVPYIIFCDDFSVWLVAGSIGDIQ